MKIETRFKAKKFRIVRFQEGIIYFLADFRRYFYFSNSALYSVGVNPVIFLNIVLKEDLELKPAS